MIEKMRKQIVNFSPFLNLGSSSSLKRNVFSNSIFALVFSIALSMDGQISQPLLAPTKPVTNSYFGIEVADPYRWMEEPASTELRDWMKAQSDYSRAKLDDLTVHNQILQELRRLDSTLDTFPGALNQVGSRWFYMRTPPPSDVYQLFMREDLTGEEKLLFNPQSLKSSNGSHFSLHFYHVAPDAACVVCPVSQGGSEEIVLRSVDVATGKLLDPPIERAEFGSWLPNSRGFFYSQLPAGNKELPATARYARRRVYLHYLGSKDDRPIFGYGLSTNVTMEPSFSSSVGTGSGCSFMMGEVRNGVGPFCELYFAPLSSCDRPEIPWRRISRFSDEILGYALDENTLFLRSRQHAPQGALLQVSLANPNLPEAKTFLPENDRVLGSVAVARDALYVTRSDAMITHLLRITRDAPDQIREIKLPLIGSVSRIISDPRRDGVILALVSWSEPSAYYRFEPRTGAFTKIKMPGDESTKALPLEVKDITVTSPDRTAVPLTILYRKGLKLDGHRPTVLFGYGAYGFSQTPGFDLSREPWFMRDGIYAIAHVRGGGELGTAWQMGGKGPHKMNGVADFIACAEYLLAEGYTSREKLAAQSISAGGVLVGRALTERPELFRAVVIESGALDALRFEITANGPANIPEWGSIRTREGFDALLKMSPYEHLKPGERYPAVLLTTGINDPRVEPWQSCKMAARLRAATTSGQPILLSVNYDEGHFQTTLSSMYEHQADLWTFLLWQLGESTM
jgi:prolyl oligopeptidase